MPKKIFLLIGACISLLLVSLQSKATELPDLIKNHLCSSIISDSIKYGSKSSKCRTNLSHRKLHIDLTAKQKAVAFKLPDGTSLNVRNTLVFNDSITPEVWRVKAGDTLDIILNNKLNDDAEGLGALNLHTHGMIVSPRIKTQTVNGHEEIVGTVGDNIFACSVPTNAVGQQDIPDNMAWNSCKSLAVSSQPDTIHYSIKLPKAHPEGVFWYHPHIHKSAASHIGAGLSGLIWVKGNKSHLKFKGAERFLMLKDFQLRPAKDNTWDAYQKNGNQKAPNCSELLSAEKHIGSCSGATDADGKWLFTVNGIVAPTIKVENSHGEIWHIANTSANMTYRLQLVESENDKLGKPIPVQIISRDGIYIANSSANFNDIKSEPIVMMPASRVDILVQPMPKGNHSGKKLEARLITTGIQTGTNSEAGDTWPAAVLANVSILSTSSTYQKMRQLDVAKTDYEQIKSATAEIKGNLTEVLAQFKKVLGHGDHHNMKMSAIPSLPACDENALKELGGDQRLIVLNIRKMQNSTDEEFVIGTTRIPSNIQNIQHEIEQLTINTSLTTPMQMAPRICTRANRTETWTIANPVSSQINGGSDPKLSTNNELHNFHLHQVKFKVLEVVNLLSPCQTSNPNGCKVEMPGGEGFVDTYPVPPGGYIKIQVHFDQTQVGDFVYHCHILEHEDGGMMSVIRVEP